MVVLIESVQLRTGVTLQYAQLGDPAGLPVIFLHGLTDSWLSFEHVLAHLPESVNALVVSQRGHGDSQRPQLGYRPEDFSDDVAAFMDALGIPAAVVVGHSMGACVAQRFAIDHPGRTLGVVLVGALAVWACNPGLEALWDSVVRLRDPIDPAFAREFQCSTLAGAVPKALFDTAVNESLKVPARVWKAALWGLLETDYSDELARIAAPALVVCGDQDALAWREQDALVAGLRNARRLTYEGVGHALHWEAPERFAADLSAFLERLSTRARAAGGSERHVLSDSAGAGTAPSLTPVLA